MGESRGKSDQGSDRDQAIEQLLGTAQRNSSSAAAGHLTTETENCVIE